MASEEYTWLADPEAAEKTLGYICVDPVMRVICFP
jgi:hypothetical protein